MVTLAIDGIGEVQVDDGFLRLSPEKQAATVEEIATRLRGSAAPAATSPPPAVPAPNSEEALFLQSVNANQPKPDTLKARGSILPVGVDEKGGMTLALPAFLEGPRQTIIDLIEGKRTASQISGREIFELGSLFAGSAGGSAALRAPRAAPEAAAVADDALRAAAPETPPPLPGAADDTVRAAVSDAPSAAPVTTEEFRAAAKSFYKKADESGVVIQPSSIRTLADDIKTTVDKAGIDATLHPRATAALKRVEGAADSALTFDRLEILRRVANAAGKGLDKDEGRIAGLIVDKIDDFVRNMADTDVIAGDPKVVSEVVPKARELWSKVAKLDLVENLVERAKISAPNFSGSGLENALRTEFRTLAKNRALMRTFTAGEQKAIKRVAKGDATSNAARAAGKFAPTGVVSAVMSGGAGGAIGGPVGAVALPAAGFLARQLATKLTQRHVTQLEDLIKASGNSAMAQASLARARETIRLLTAETSAATEPEPKRR